jgi:hypothetical protein
MRTISLLFLVVCVSACGGGEGGLSPDAGSGSGSGELPAFAHEGVWRVTSHLRNPDGCDGADQPVTDEATHFSYELRVPIDNNPEYSLVAWRECSSARDCEEEIDLGESLYVFEGAWRRTTAYVGSADQACPITYPQYGGVEATSSGIRLEKRRLSGTLPLPASGDCAADAEPSRSQVEAFACEALEVIEAVPAD